MGRRPLPKRITPFVIRLLIQMTTCGISNPFELLSHSLGQVTNALLTRSPLSNRIATITPFDLHVLSTPPAFILSQDQTLRKNIFHQFLGVSYGSYWIDQVLASYHYSIVKVLLELLHVHAFERQHRGRDFTHLHSPCQGLGTKRRCFPLLLSFRDHIGRLSDVVGAVSPATFSCYRSAFRQDLNFQIGLSFYALPSRLSRVVATKYRRCLTSTSALQLDEFRVGFGDIRFLWISLAF